MEQTKWFILSHFFLKLNRMIGLLSQGTCQFSLDTVQYSTTQISCQNFSFSDRYRYTSEEEKKTKRTSAEKHIANAEIDILQWHSKTEETNWPSEMPFAKWQQLNGPRKSISIAFVVQSSSIRSPLFDAKKKKNQLLPLSHFRFRRHCTTMRFNRFWRPVRVRLLAHSLEKC